MEYSIINRFWVNIIFIYNNLSSFMRAPGEREDEARTDTNEVWLAGEGPARIHRFLENFLFIYLSWPALA